MVMVISTPMSKESHMFALEQGIRDGKITGGLYLHLPSYWVNPLITTDLLKNSWETDNFGFQQEFEAVYLDQMESAFKKSVIDACRQDPVGDYKTVRKGETLWMGVDLGLKNDGTAISVVAASETGECRLIHHELHKAGLAPYDDLEELKIQDMAQRIDYLWDYYGVLGGVMDQWNAPGLKSHLQSRAKDALQHVEFNATYNDRLARHIIAMISQQRLTIYADSEDWENDTSLLREFVRLQRRQSGGDPPKIRLMAPNVKGFHDDQYSALSRALWAAKLGVEEGMPGTHGSHNPAYQRLANDLKERASALRRRSVTSTERHIATNPLRRRMFGR
jgi:hypothetical protein